MDLKLKEKKALVLASSSGIGFGIAKQFAEEKVHVAISSSNRERIDAASKKIPGSTPFVCDLGKKGEGEKLVRQVIKAFGGIDIIVTNTGGPPKGELADISLEEWEKQFQLIFLSAVETIKEAAKEMKMKKWGRIIMILSTSVREVVPKLILSTGLRTGLLGLMRALTQELAKDNITVNAILPGYTRTERLAAFAAEEELIKEIPMGRLGEVEEIAALVAFLASEKAGYITGQWISCDGGLVKGF